MATVYEADDTFNTNDPQPITIGDRSRDGMLEIADTRWDFNGTMYVTVRELMGVRPSYLDASGLSIAKMRRFARRAIAHPEHTRSSRVIQRNYFDGCTHVTFAVSRLSVTA